VGGASWKKIGEYKWDLEMTTAADTAEEAADAVADAVALVAEAAADTADLATCTRQSAQTAGRSAKCRSSQQKEGLFTAGTASPSTKNSNRNFLDGWRPFFAPQKRAPFSLWRKSVKPTKAISSSCF